MSDLPDTADISGRRAARLLANLQLPVAPEDTPAFAGTTEPAFSGTVSIYDRVEIGSPSGGSAYPFALNGIGYIEGASGAFGWIFNNLTTGNTATFTGAAADIYELNSVGGWKLQFGGSTKLTVSTTGVAVTGFGANGASPQTAYTLPAAATDLATVITLANAIRLALIANGTCA